MSRPKRCSCPASGKERFRDERAAKVALRAARRQRGHAALEGVTAHWQVIRYYWCEDCSGYHLTSKAKIGL